MTSTINEDERKKERKKEGKEGKELTLFVYSFCFC
jgi:hypothetical protein